MESNNQEENYLNIVKIFKSLGEEREINIGQILSSLEHKTEEVFLIKEGNARLISRINNKLTSVAKLTKGDFIGIASILNNKPIEEIRASENLVVYSLKVHQFLKIYNDKLNIRDFFGNKIWDSELLYIIKRFPNFYNKNLIISSNLLNQFSRNAQVVEAKLDEIKNSLNNDRVLFSNYFSNDCEIWSEIKTIFEGEKFLQNKSIFPLKIISLPKNLEILKTEKLNILNKIKNKKSNKVNQPNNVSKSVKSYFKKTNPDQKLFATSKGQLENTLACFEIIAMRMDFPFRKESVKNSLKKYLINHKYISLKICGEIASYHELQINISSINSKMAYRLKTPALMKWENNFAVISKIHKEEMEIIIPSQGNKKINFENINSYYPNGIEVLNLEKTNLTQQKIFGLNWFYPFLKKYKGVFIQIIIAGFVIQFLTLANPLLIQVIIDKVISQRSLDTLQVLGIALLFVTIFEGILGSLKSFLLSDTCNRIDKKISNEIIDHLLGLPLKFFQQRRTGELSSRLGELEKIRNFLTSQALTTILDGAFSIIYIFVMIAYSIKLTFISLIILPIQILLTFFGGPLFKKQFRKVAEANAKSQSHLIEILNGIETVKSQNYESKSKLQWQKLYEKLINKSFEKTITGTIFIQSSQALQKISQLLVLWFGAGMVLQGYISLGQLIAFRIISGYVTQPLLRLSNIWQEIQELKISFERLADIVNTKKEFNNLEKSKILMPQIKGYVDFKNIFFKFGNKPNYLLNGVNFSVKPNSFVAIVGQSGSGKSTLMKLIYRLYSPNEGKIYIDGLDISKVELNSLRNQIGIVPQEPLLFKGTIKDNITLQDNDISEKEIINASKIACAHDFIMELPEGYSTLISEKGSTLSGGQKQRITIARTLLKNPKILILDEATSSLDYTNERNVYENLLNNSTKKSIFFITHRLSIIQEANLIIVIHKGRIDEVGTHKELVDKQGRYFALLNQSLEK